MPNFSRFRILLILLLALPATGCLFHSHKVERQVSTAPLKNATQQDLIAAINEQASKIHALQATVDIDTSVGGSERGKITDYKQIRGYVLLRKPAMLRMIGLLPIVRNKAFDMVSDGKKFELWIPPKNKFVVGNNDVVATNPQQPMENIRPKAIYDALLVHNIDPNDIAILENGFETVLDSKRHSVEQPDYELDVIERGENGWYLARKIVFSRTDLLPRRQLLYNQKSELVTEATYDNYKDQAGITFPNSIEIYRPLEEYDITLTMVKLQLNESLADDQFVLQQPPGAEVVHLDRAQAPNQRGGSAAPNTK